MEKIKAEIVADSINLQGNRITTYLLTFPRFVLAQLNTHRVFSKNSASSRAKKKKKMVKMVKEDPFIPIAWQKHHSGMQGNEYFTEECIIGNENKPVKISKRRNLHYSAANQFRPLLQSWHTSRVNAIKTATELYKMGVTKQLCNRLLEPFMWHKVLLTGTEFENFFKLRCPKYIFGKATNKPKIWKSKKDAIKDFPHWETHNDLFWRTMNDSQSEIHMQALAEAMWDAMNESTPKQLQAGEWHIPFSENMDEEKLNEIMPEIQPASLNWYINKIKQLKIEIATARCARLSYMTFDGEIDYKKDLKLHDTLLESHHASPFEHCCRAVTEEEYNENFKGKEKGWFRNFKGFKSYRQILEE